jgi:hypothetical protein
MKPVEKAKRLDEMAQRIRSMLESLEPLDNLQAQRYLGIVRSSLLQAARNLELAFETVMNTPERVTERSATQTDGSEPEHKRD